MVFGIFIWYISLISDSFMSVKVDLSPFVMEIKFYPLQCLREIEIHGSLHC